MNIWKAKKRHSKPDVWASEIRLKNISPTRLGKVQRLLSRLEKEGFDAGIS